jgi:glycosyltransferase involved in cell wall biosynthesis
MDKVSVKPTLLIIGPVCGAPGGVNIHIRRLAKLLEDDFHFSYIDESREIDVDTYNIRSKKIGPFLKLFSSANIVNIHSAIGILRLVYVIIAKIFLKKVVLVIHAWNPNKSLLTTLFTKLSIILSDKTILVNKSISTYLNVTNFVELAAFIPPDASEFKPLPDELLQKLQDRSGKIIIANAFRVDILNGIDVYGIDSCLDIARQFKKNMIDAKIYFVISNISYNVDVLQQYLNFIETEKLGNFIEIIPKSLSFISFMKHADLILRPTSTDGDALTIREALYLQKDIIASDVVLRPIGTTLYQFGNMDDLYNKIIHLLDSKKEHDALDEHKSRAAYHDMYMTVFDFNEKKNESASE